MANPTTNGKITRKAINPEAFEVVDEIPPVTRRPGGGPRKSKWDKLNEALRAKPGMKVAYRNVSASTGTDLSRRFNLKTENRSVEGYEEGRVDLYVQYDAEHEKELVKDRKARAAAAAKAKAAEEAAGQVPTQPVNA